MKRQNLKSDKVKQLRKVHPYSISYNEKKNLWWTQIGKGRSDRKQITAKTEEELINKLLVFYHLTSNLSELMEEWLDSRIQTGEIATSTKDNIMWRIRRLASESLLTSDIGTISEDVLKADLTAQIDKINASRKEVKLREVKDYLNSIRALYTELRHRGHVNSNPAEFLNYRIFKRKCNTTVKTPDEEAMPYTDMERLREDVSEDYQNTRNPRALMVLLSIDTGVRASELPPLKKNDLVCDGTKLRVNKMQVKYSRDGHTIYETVGWTKNEKGISKGGRNIPLLPSAMKTISTAINASNCTLLFPDEHGKEITKDSYERYLLRHCRKLGITTTNNHSIRKGFCSYVLSQQLNLPPEARAVILGHSVEVDQKFYTFAGSTTQMAVDSVFAQIRSSTTQAHFDNASCAVNRLAHKENPQKH